MFIPCMCCGRELPDNWSWWVCDTCGYRVCPSCFPSYKCPKCTWGQHKVITTANNFMRTCINSVKKNPAIKHSELCKNPLNPVNAS
jgi:hypothetical protein